MTNFQITGVRTEWPRGARHEHITDVELNDNPNFILPRSIVINDLLSPTGDRYYTFAGGEYAEVVVRRCPHCYGADYITTLPDSTTQNNLLSLKRI
jgi:hypothetical protein